MRGSVLAYAFAAVLLTGCTGLSQHLASVIDRDHARTQRVLADTRDGHAQVAESSDGVIVSDGIWLSGTPMQLEREGTLPAVFSQPATFDREVGSLREFAEHVSRLSHIATRVAPDAAAGPQLAPATAPSVPVPVLGASPPPLPTVPGLSGDTGAHPWGASQRTRIVYRDGDLRGLLDTATTRFGVSWKYADGAIEFFVTDTRTFQVSAIPGDATVNANVVSGASSDGSSAQAGGYGQAGTAGAGAGAGGGTGNGTATVTSNNTANTVVNSQLSVFNSLRASIQAMLSHYGHVVSSPATGSITVTDTPDVLDRVAAFMRAQNASLSKQVLINVTVLSVAQSAQDSYGINWTAVYQALGTAFTITSVFPTTATNPVSLAAQVITPNSRAAGTQAIISALSSQGRVRRKTSASITTLNNQPVPLQVATQQGYLASVSTTNTANVGSSTALVPGTVTTGFNMTLLPHILENSTVLLQFYTNISSLIQLRTVPAGNGQSIQVPEVDTRNFLQRVSMKSGETLILSGYEGVNDDLAQRGVGAPQNYLLGGGFDGSRQREAIVILITPVAMNGS
ncbi:MULTISPECIES: PilN family type IVB pilus formation outer membrane protein [unclassified Burkholderia]|uniref:PilN family type IVB pilus formation outer membrane protein n=1 Tax=unclassified Burkholderia TaxID=2613784 RepID=UPI001E36B73E|nr:MULTISPECIES: PilN family type IVB pilus formation outer membrane protein [unclassified Burkholderia]UEP32611.1 PilN family type IVB pilus formation outer membrane protein [Burkholderia sp. B21-007]UEP46330.1 PilN family type IVB pilus formation outer membrane protein [Burkholderia sp. B21-005]